MKCFQKKPSSMVDQVVLEGTRAILNTLAGGTAYVQGEKSVAEWSRVIGERGAELLPRTIGLAPQNFPLRAVHMANGRLVFLVEYPPSVRTVPWISEKSKADYGSGTQYRDVTIALPYVLFFITTSWQGILRESSVYFRTEPLARADYSDELLDCHFLNCSVEAHGVYCWLCSQYMPSVIAQRQSLVEFVAACIDYFWFSAFNRSSEHHEGQSFFGKGRKEGPQEIPDVRIQTIQSWEEATKADPSFVLSVPWNPAGRTVADVFCELTGGELQWPFDDASHLGTLIVTKQKKGGLS